MRSGPAGAGEGDGTSMQRTNRARAHTAQMLMWNVELPSIVLQSQEHRMSLHRQLASRYIARQVPFSSLSCAKYITTADVAVLADLFQRYNLLAPPSSTSANQDGFDSGFGYGAKLGEGMRELLRPIISPPSTAVRQPRCSAVGTPPRGGGTTQSSKPLRVGQLKRPSTRGTDSARSSFRIVPGSNSKLQGPRRGLASPPESSVAPPEQGLDTGATRNVANLFTHESGDAALNTSWIVEVLLEMVAHNMESIGNVTTHGVQSVSSNTNSSNDAPAAERSPSGNTYSGTTKDFFSTAAGHGAGTSTEMDNLSLANLAATTYQNRRLETRTEQLRTWREELKNWAALLSQPCHGREHSYIAEQCALQGDFLIQYSQAIRRFVENTTGGSALDLNMDGARPRPTIHRMAKLPDGRIVVSLLPSRRVSMSTKLLAENSMAEISDPDSDEKVPDSPDGAVGHSSPVPELRLSSPTSATAPPAIISRPLRKGQVTVDSPAFASVSRNRPNNVSWFSLNEARTGDEGEGEGERGGGLRTPRRGLSDVTLTSPNGPTMGHTLSTNPSFVALEGLRHESSGFSTPRHQQTRDWSEWMGSSSDDNTQAYTMSVGTADESSNFGRCYSGGMISAIASSYSLPLKELLLHPTLHATRLFEPFVPNTGAAAAAATAAAAAAATPAENRPSSAAPAASIASPRSTYLIMNERRRQRLPPQSLVCWSDVANNFMMGMENTWLSQQQDEMYVRVPTALLEEIGETTVAPAASSAGGGPVGVKELLRLSPHEDEFPEQRRTKPDGEEYDSDDSASGSNAVPMTTIGGQCRRRFLRNGTDESAAMQQNALSSMNAFAEAMRSLHLQSSDHVLVTPSQRYIVTSSKDGLIKVWDTVQGNFHSNIVNVGATWVLGMSWLHGEEFLMVTTSKAEITIVNFPAGRVVLKMRGCTTLATAIMRVKQPSTAYTQRYGLKPGECGPHKTTLKDGMSMVEYHSVEEMTHAQAEEMVSALPIIGFVMPTSVHFDQHTHLFFFGTFGGVVGCVDLSNTLKRSALHAAAGGAAWTGSLSLHCVIPVHQLALSNYAAIASPTADGVSGYPRIAPPNTLTTAVPPPGNADNGCSVNSVFYCAVSHCIISSCQNGEIVRTPFAKDVVSLEYTAGPPVLVAQMPRAIRFMAEGAGGRQFVTVHSDRRALLWVVGRTATELVHQFPQEAYDIVDACFFNAKQQVALLMADHSIRVYDVRGSRPLTSVQANRGTGSRVEDMASMTIKCSANDVDGCLAYVPSSKRLVCALRGPVLYEPAAKGVDTDAADRRFSNAVLASLSKERDEFAQRLRQEERYGSLRPSLQLDAAQISDVEGDIVARARQAQVDAAQACAMRRLAPHRTHRTAVVNMVVHTERSELHTFSTDTWRIWSLRTGELLQTEVNVPNAVGKEMEIHGRQAYITYSGWSTYNQNRIVAGTRGGLIVTLDSVVGSVIHAVEAFKEYDPSAGPLMDHDVSAITCYRSRTLLCSGRTCIVRRYEAGSVAASGEEAYVSMSVRLPSSCGSAASTITSCCVVLETHMCLGTADTHLYFFRMVDRSAPLHVEVLRSADGTPDVGRVIGVYYINEKNQDALVAVVDSGIIFVYSYMQSKMLMRYRMTLRSPTLYLTATALSSDESLLFLGDSSGFAHVVQLPRILPDGASTTVLTTPAPVATLKERELRLSGSFKAAASGISSLNTYMTSAVGSLDVNAENPLEGVDTGLNLTTLSPSTVFGDGATVLLLVGSLDGNVRLLFLSSSPLSNDFYMSSIGSTGGSYSLSGAVAGGTIPTLQERRTFMSSPSEGSGQSESLNGTRILAPQMGPVGGPVNRYSGYPRGRSTAAGRYVPAVIGLFGVDQWDLRDPHTFSEHQHASIMAELNIQLPSLLSAPDGDSTMRRSLGTTSLQSNNDEAALLYDVLRRSRRISSSVPPKTQSLNCTSKQSTIGRGVGPNAATNSLSPPSVSPGATLNRGTPHVRSGSPGAQQLKATTKTATAPVATSVPDAPLSHTIDTVLGRSTPPARLLAMEPPPASPTIDAPPPAAPVRPQRSFIGMKNERNPLVHSYPVSLLHKMGALHPLDQTPEVNAETGEPMLMLAEDAFQPWALYETSTDAQGDGPFNEPPSSSPQLPLPPKVPRQFSSSSPESMFSPPSGPIYPRRSTVRGTSLMEEGGPSAFLTEIGMGPARFSLAHHTGAEEGEAGVGAVAEADTMSNMPNSLLNASSVFLTVSIPPALASTRRQGALDTATEPSTPIGVRGSASSYSLTRVPETSESPSSVMKQMSSATGAAGKMPGGHTLPIIHPVEEESQLCRTASAGRLVATIEPAAVSSMMTPPSRPSFEALSLPYHHAVTNRHAKLLSQLSDIDVETLRRRQDLLLLDHAASRLRMVRRTRSGVSSAGLPSLSDRIERIPPQSWVGTASASMSTSGAKLPPFNASMGDAADCFSTSMDATGSMKGPGNMYGLNLSFLAQSTEPVGSRRGTELGTSARMLLSKKKQSYSRNDSTSTTIGVGVETLASARRERVSSRAASTTLIPVPKGATKKPLSPSPQQMLQPLKIELPSTLQDSESERMWLARFQAIFNADSASPQSRPGSRQNAGANRRGGDAAGGNSSSGSPRPLHHT